MSKKKIPIVLADGEFDEINGDETVMASTILTIPDYVGNPIYFKSFLFGYSLDASRTAYVNVFVHPDFHKGKDTKKRKALIAEHMQSRISWIFTYGERLFRGETND